MSARAEERLPYAPLARFVGPMLQRTLHGRLQESEADQHVIAEHVGLSSRTICRYVRDGIPLARADDIACRFGVHPSAIWPDWFTRCEAVS
jgi:hypothetical protein